MLPTWLCAVSAQVRQARHRSARRAQFVGLLIGMQRAERRALVHAAIYRRLAERTPDVDQRSLLLLLARHAERRAARWATQRRRWGVAGGPERIGWTDRLWGWWVLQHSVAGALDWLHHDDRGERAVTRHLDAVRQYLRDTQEAGER